MCDFIVIYDGRASQVALTPFDRRVQEAETGFFNLGFPSPYRDTGSPLIPVLRWVTAQPKDAHILVPRTCGVVTLCGTKEFAGEVRLRMLRWEDYPGLLGCAKVIMRSF